MNVEYKVAVWASGRYQWQVAAAAQISENKLSKFLRGHATLSTAEIMRLRGVLGLPIDQAVAQAAQVG
jgi:hypothetical protein